MGTPGHGGSGGAGSGAGGDRTRPEVAVLLYPGCSFFEIALATETLAPRCRLLWLTPDGVAHAASTGCAVQADGGFDRLLQQPVAAVLVPGGDPASILLPRPLAAAALQAAAGRGALLAGICAGSLVLASAGLLRGRRGTHNYTAEHASPEAVATTAPYWAGLQFERANLVADGQVITAQPWAYRAFAAAVAQRLGVLDAAAAQALADYPQRRAYPPG